MEPLLLEQKGSEANLVLTLEPALTAAIAYLVLGERLSALGLVGSAIILAGVVLLHAEGRPSVRSTASSDCAAPELRSESRG